MYMFCIIVIISKNIVLKCIKTNVCFSPLLYLGKNIENMFNIRKNSSKNHLDSCYYAMLLLKLFSVQVHSCEIQINLRSVVTDFSMAIVFRLPTLSKRDPTQVFSCEYCEIFKNTYFEGHLRTPAYEYHFTYYFGVLFLRPHFNVLLSIMIQRLKRCKDNVVLSTILRRCCDVLITTSFYQQHKNVAWTSFE